MNTASFTCYSTDQLPEAARWLLEHTEWGRVYAFYGKMGAGKTTFIKAICNELGVSDVVNSPTFALINVYFTQGGDQIYHFDFYRVKNLREVYDIGYEDYFYGTSRCLIEWPELVEELLPSGSIKVYLVENENDGSRLITVGSP